MERIGLTLFALALATVWWLMTGDGANPSNGPREAQLRKWIGQMLVIGFPGVSHSEEWPTRVSHMIKRGEISGVLLLGRNIVSPGQLRRFTRALADTGGAVKPFIAVDQEGGAVQRLSPGKGFVGLPAAKNVAAMSSNAAYHLYAQQARQLAESGITINLAPVVDLDVNAQNPIIADLDRSFGEMPGVVTQYARTFVKAHFDAGVLTVAKHFPGHGSGSTDPHVTAVNVSGQWKADELVPFTALMQDRVPVPLIMVGHVVLEGFSDGLAPVSLSRRAVTDILRNRLGYKGLILTDDLDMAAIRGRYSIEEAFVKAVAAGNDLIMSANKEAPDPLLVAKVTDAIVAAVDRGEIKESRIRESFERILSVKRLVARAFPRPSADACAARHCYPLPAAAMR